MSENTLATSSEGVEFPRPCDDWDALATAADAAGRWAARQLACRCPLQYLDRAGQILVHVEPANSPMAAWLSAHRHGTGSPNAALRGSYLTITHISPISRDWDQIQAQLNEVMGRTATPEQVRTREAIAAMLPGYELGEPGLVPQCNGAPTTNPAQSNCYAAVGCRR